MTSRHGPFCAAFREALSARIDGELDDERALLDHLAGCCACREHERALAALAPQWRSLRAAAPPPDLWARLEQSERCGRPRRAHPVLSIGARVAALLIGYVGAWAVVRALDEPPRRARQPHVPAVSDGRGGTEFFAASTATTAPAALFASLPEYQLLRRFPAPLEDNR